MYTRDCHLIYEAYDMNAIPLIRRFELKPTSDGYIIINKALKGPSNVVARFDKDEEEAAQKRYEYLSKALDRPAITQGFDRLKQDLRSDQ